MSDKKILRFWFSEKMLSMINHMRRFDSMPNRRLEVFIDGKWQQYTVLSHDEDHGCKWDDMVFLGEVESPAEIRLNGRVGQVD